jgi:hypothetical protein
MPAIICKNCSEPINVEQALKTTPYSWPHLNSIWHICKNCKEGNHLKFLEHKVQIINITGAPGPTWELVQSEKNEAVEHVVNDNGCFLNVWYNGNLYSTKARE